MYKFIIIYLMIINLSSFIIMYIDKRRAIKHKIRISEKTLIGLSIIGGVIGIYIGMYKFRHKTKKFKFKVGIPLILVVEILFLIKCIRTL